MLARVRFFIRHALRAMGRSLGLTALAVVTIAVSLAVLATFALVVDNLRRIATELGDQVGLSAYLDPNAIPAGRALRDEVATWAEVDRVWVLTSSAALEDFRAQLGEDAVLLEGLPADVLPPSVEVRLRSQAWPVERVELLAQRLAAAEGVSDVRYGQEDIERIAALLGVVRSAAFVLGLSLSFATVLVIYNTIRLTLYARRDEIEIMSLVGATGGFVRAPFVLEGAIQGLLGGALAAAVVFALEEALLVALERALTFARGTGVSLQFVPPEFGLTLLLAGALLGLVGSALAVGKFLKL
ncbi:MAG: permease-like cell division protein FtsX [Myxococcota bacterium]